LNALALRAELGVEGDVQMIELGHALVERLGEIEAEFSADGFSCRGQADRPGRWFQK
jgi:hypothetical protein